MDRESEDLTWSPSAYAWDPHRLVAVPNEPKESVSVLLQAAAAAGTQPESLVTPVLGPAGSVHQSLSAKCKVEGCARLLQDEKPYYQRFMVCEEHMRSSAITVDGVVCRFCQQCARFEPIEAFDGTKRSCRARLQEHNKRRRKAGTNRVLRRQRRSASASKTGSTHHAAASITEGPPHQTSSGALLTGTAAATQSASRSSCPAVDMALEIGSNEDPRHITRSPRDERLDSVYEQHTDVALHRYDSRLDKLPNCEAGVAAISTVTDMTATSTPSSGELQYTQRQHQPPMQEKNMLEVLQHQQQGGMQIKATALRPAKPDPVLGSWQGVSTSHTKPPQQVQPASQVATGSMDSGQVLLQRFLGSCDSMCTPAEEQQPPASLRVHANCTALSANSATALPAHLYKAAPTTQYLHPNQLPQMVSHGNRFDGMATASAAHHSPPQQQLQPRQLAPQRSTCTSLLQQPQQQQQTQRRNWETIEAEFLLDQLIAESQLPLQGSEITSSRSGLCEWCNSTSCTCNTVAQGMGSAATNSAQQQAFQQPYDPSAALHNPGSAVQFTAPLLKPENAHEAAVNRWIMGSNAPSQQQGMYCEGLHPGVDPRPACHTAARAEDTTELLKQHHMGVAMSQAGQPLHTHARQVQYQQQLETQQKQLSTLQQLQYQGEDCGGLLLGTEDMAVHSDMEEDLLIDQQIQEYMQRAHMQAVLSASKQEVVAPEASFVCASHTMLPNGGAGSMCGAHGNVHAGEHTGSWFATAPVAAAAAPAGEAWYSRSHVQSGSAPLQYSQVQQSHHSGMIPSNAAWQAPQHPQWHNSMPQCYQGVPSDVQSAVVQQRQQHDTFDAALQIARGGASAAAYGQSVDSTVRLSMKLHDVTPNQLNHNMMTSLNNVLGEVGGVVETGYMRHGCVHLLLQLRVPVAAADQQGNIASNGPAAVDATTAVSTALAGMSSTAWARALVHSSSAESRGNRHADDMAVHGGRQQPLSLTVHLPDGRAIVMGPGLEVVPGEDDSSNEAVGPPHTTVQVLAESLGASDRPRTQPVEPTLQLVVPCAVRGQGSTVTVMAVGSGLNTSGCAVLARMQGMFLPATVALTSTTRASHAAGGSSEHLRIEIQRLQHDGLLYIEFQQGLLLSECKPVLVVQDDAVLAELRDLNLQVAAGGNKQSVAERLLIDFGRLLDFRAISEAHKGTETAEEQEEQVEDRAAAAVAGPVGFVEDSAYEEAINQREEQEAGTGQGSASSAASEGAALSAATTVQASSASSCSLGAADSSEIAVAGVGASQAPAQHAASSTDGSSSTSATTASGSGKRRISFLNKAVQGRATPSSSGAASSSGSSGFSTASRRLRQSFERLVDSTKSIGWRPGAKLRRGSSGSATGVARRARSLDLSSCYSRAASYERQAAAEGSFSNGLASSFDDGAADMRASSGGIRTVVNVEETVEQVDRVDGQLLQDQQDEVPQELHNHSGADSDHRQYGDDAADTDSLQDEEQQIIMHPLLDVDYKACMMDIGVRLLQYFLDKGCPASCQLILDTLLTHAAPVASFPAVAAAVRAGDQLSILHRAVRSGSTAMLIMVLRWGVQHRYKLSWDSPGPLGLTPLHLAALCGQASGIATAVLKSSPAVAPLWFHLAARDGCTPAIYASKLGLNSLNRLAWMMLHGGRPLRLPGPQMQQLPAAGSSSVQQSSQQRERLTRQQRNAVAAAAMAEGSDTGYGVASQGANEELLQQLTANRPLPPLLEHSASGSSTAVALAAGDTTGHHGTRPADVAGALLEGGTCNRAGGGVPVTSNITAAPPTDCAVSGMDHQTGATAGNAYNTLPRPPHHGHSASISTRGRQVMEVKAGIAKSGSGATSQAGQQQNVKKQPKRQLKKKESISDSAESYDAVLMYGTGPGKGLLGSDFTASPLGSFARRSASELHGSSSSGSNSSSYTARLSALCAHSFSCLDSAMSEPTKFEQGLHTVLAAVHVLLMLLMAVAVLQASGWWLAASVVGLLAVSNAKQLVHALQQKGTRSALLDPDSLHERMQLWVVSAVAPIRVQHSKVTLMFDDPALEGRYKQELAKAQWTSDMTICTLVKALVVLLPLLLRTCGSAAASYLPTAVSASLKMWLLSPACQLTGAAACGIPLAAALLVPGSYHKLRDFVLAGFQATLLATLQQPLLVTATAGAAAEHVLFQSISAVLLLVMLRQRVGWVLLQAAWSVGTCVMLLKAQALAIGAHAAVPSDLGVHLSLLMAAMALCYMRERIDRNMFLQSCTNSKLQMMKQA